MGKRWVRFNAVTGAVLETLTVSKDNIKKDINGYDEIELEIPAYGLSSNARLNWASSFLYPWAFGVALIDDDTSTCEAAGIIIKRSFVGSEEMITVTAYNVMEYLKKLRIPAIHTTITTNAGLEVRGDTWGEVYAEAIRHGMDTTGAPEGTVFYKNLVLLPKTGESKVRDTVINYQTTVFEFITGLRDSVVWTSGEELRFNPVLNIAESKIVWVQQSGTTTQPHINGENKITAGTAAGEESSGSWKVAEFTWEDDASNSYNRMVINGSTDREAPFVGVKQTTDVPGPTLTEAFDSGTDLNALQMEVQLTTRLNAGLWTEKNINLTIEEDFGGFWRGQVGSMIVVEPGEKTAGAGVFGRVVEVSWSSNEPGRFELSIMPKAARYPGLPSQKDRDAMGAGDKDDTGGFDSGKLPDLEGGFGGNTGGDIPEFEDGGFVRPISIKGTVYDANGFPFAGVTVRAYTDAALTTEAGSTRTTPDGTYTLSVGSKTQYWLTASVGSHMESHPNNPISVEDDPLEGVDFQLSITNPLKLYEVTGRIVNNGFGLANAVVGVTSGYTRPDFFASGYHQFIRVRTKEDGSFNFWLPSGVYFLGKGDGATSGDEGAWFNFEVSGMDLNLGDLDNLKSPYINVTVFDAGIQTPFVRVEAFSDNALVNKIGEAFTTVDPGGNSTTNGYAQILLPANFNGDIFIRAEKEGRIGYATAIKDKTTRIHLHSAVPELGFRKVTGKITYLGVPYVNHFFHIASGFVSNPAYSTNTDGVLNQTVVFTDKQGEFTAYLPDGSYRLSGNTTVAQALRYNFSVAGEDEDLGQIDYYEADTPKYVKVNVKVSGTAMPFCKVEAYSDNLYVNKISEAYTAPPQGGANGEKSFAYVRLPKDATGSVYLRASYNDTEGFLTAPVSTNPVIEYSPIHSISITTPTHVVSGTVLAQDGVTPVPNAPVSFFCETIREAGFGANQYASMNPDFILYTDASGNYSVSLPKGSSWTVASVPVYGGGNISKSYQIKVVADIILNLRRLVDSDRFLVWVSVLAAGIGVSGATVKFYSDSAHTNLIQQYDYSHNLGTRSVSTGYNVYESVVAYFSFSETPNIYVVAEKGTSRAVGIITRGESSTFTGLNLSLGDSHAVTGRVFASDGTTPVSNAPVSFFCETNRTAAFGGNQYAVLSSEMIQYTNAQGEYAISLPAGSRWTVASVGFAGGSNISESKQLFINSDTREDLIRMLDADRFLVGVRVYIGRSPAHGATVKFYSDADHTGLIGEYVYGHNLASPLASTTYSDSGYSVVAYFNHTEHKSLFVTAEKNGASTEAQITRSNSTNFLLVDLYLADTYQVSGTVYQADGATPAADEIVQAFTTSYPAVIKSTVTGPDGGYLIELPQGKYNLRASITATALRKWEHIEITDSALTKDFIVGANGRSIQGAAKIANTYYPVEWEAELMVYSDSGYTVLIDRQKLTGGLDGNIGYQNNSIPANQQVWVRVRYNGLDYPAAAPVPAGAAGSTTTVPLINIERTEFPVSGRVLNSDGTAAASQIVRFYNNSSNLYTYKQATTDASGKYSTTLPAGTYYVRGSSPTQLAGDGPVKVAGLTVMPDMKVATRRSIAVTVTTGGVPRAGVEVTAETAEGSVVDRSVSHSMSLTSNAYVYPTEDATILRVSSDQTTLTYNIPATSSAVFTVELPA